VCATFYSELWNGVRCGPVAAVEHFGVDEVVEYVILVFVHHVLSTAGL